MNVKHIVSAFVLAVLLLASCGVSDYHHVKVGRVEPVHVTRFDSLVYNYVNEPDSLQRQALEEQAGDFWTIYNLHLMRFLGAPYFYESLTRYMEISNVKKLYDDTQRMYSDMSDIEASLALMLARYKKLFPDGKDYIFQSHISGLKIPVVAVDSLISVSLDCYLGADYELYETRYKVYEMPLHSCECLLPDVGEVMVRNMIPAPKGNLLEVMVYEGIVAHVLAGVLDDATVTTVLRYTPEQEAWCMQYEEEIWNKIVEQCHLFTHDRMTINKYIYPGPFTATLTQDSPARVGRWVGWRIVQRYMEEEHVSIEELVNDKTPYMDMFQKSYYNAR